MTSPQDESGVSHASGELPNGAPGARISYILPVHNSAPFLRNVVETLVGRLRADGGRAEIFLIENGSTDDSWRTATDIARDLSSPEVLVAADRTAKGMGNAYRRGMELATGELLVLTAADLPFGFTDLDSYLRAEPAPEIAIGSKGHPESRVRVARLRRLMSFGFRTWTRLLLGLRLRDTQGTILLRREVADEVSPHLACSDFLIATEIVAWSVRHGRRPVELPVVYEQAPRPSTVAPLVDAWRMARGTVELRRRLHSQALDGSAA